MAQAVLLRQWQAPWLDPLVECLRRWLAPVGRLGRLAPWLALLAGCQLPRRCPHKPDLPPVLLARACRNR